jgi:hypothetical protein
MADEGRDHAPRVGDITVSVAELTPIAEDLALSPLTRLGILRLIRELLVEKADLEGFNWSV